MKKLALVPAAALALTGLAASPVSAASEAPTAVPSADTQPASQPGALQKAGAQGASVQAGEGDIAVSADSVTIDEFAENGVGIAGAGLAPETDYTLTVAPSGGQNVGTYDTTITTDGDGAFEDGVEAVGEARPEFVGGYTVTVSNTEDAEESYTTSFEVTDDDSRDDPSTPAADPKVSPETTTISQSDFNKDGIKVTGEGFTPNGAVTVVGAATQSPFGTAEVTADDEGTISAAVKYEGEEELEPGEYAVTAVDQETETTADPQNFTITKDETKEPSDPSTPAAEAKLSVSPDSITPADFVKENTGVTLTVENCVPDENVRYLVNPKGQSNVTAFDKTVTADDEGKASVNVYGTSHSNPSAYLGDYDVTVTCGDAELTGDFSVEKDPNAGGSDGNEDGNEDGNGGGDLPRTGIELTGLVGGGALLLIGGIAVALTKRRKKTAQDPADI